MPDATWSSELIDRGKIDPYFYCIAKIDQPTDSESNNQSSDKEPPAILGGGHQSRSKGEQTRCDDDGAFSPHKVVELAGQESEGPGPTNRDRNHPFLPHEIQVEMIPELKTRRNSVTTLPPEMS